MKIVKYIVGGCFSLIVCCLLTACSEDVSLSDMAWKRLPDFPGVARASAVGFYCDSSLYLGLGRAEQRTDFITDFYALDLRDSTWKQIKSFPGEGRSNAVAGVIGGKAYVGMGSQGLYKNYRDFWCYNPQTNEWERKADFPDKACNELIGAVLDSCLYVCWGYDSETTNDNVWKYNPADNTWSLAGRLNYKRVSATGFGLGNKLYVGTGFQDQNYKDWYSYDVTTKSLRKLASLPDSRMLSNAIGIGNRGFVLLGRFWNGTLNNGRVLDDVLEYDPAANQWMRRSSFPGGGRQNAVVLSDGQYGYVLTGENNTERKNDCWRFMP